MSAHPKPAAPSVAFADFAADGALLGNSPGFLDEGLPGVTAYVQQFTHFDGDLANDQRRIDVADHWKRPGAAIHAGEAGGGQVLLCSHPRAGGGVSLLAVTTATPVADGGIARQIVDNHPMPMWVNDLVSGDILYRNAKAIELFALNDGPDPSGSVSQLFPDNAENRRLVQDLRDRRSIENCVIEAQTTAGRPFWIYGGASLFEFNGTDAVLGVVQNTTALKQHDDELHRVRVLLDDALRGVNEGCALFDDDDQLIVCNDRYRELNKGIQEFIAPGVYWETLLREMARRKLAQHTQGRTEAWVQEILRLSESEEPFEIVRTDGTVTSVTVRPTSLGGFILSEADITARRRAEQSAADSEQMLSKILEASPANLCMSQIGSGEIIYQSPSCADLLGRPESARNHFDDPVSRADFLTELLPSGRVDDFNAVARRDDGTTFPALFSARIIDYRGEEVMVSTVTDLTQQIAAEQSIKDAGIRLRDAIEALSEGFILYDAEERVVMANRRFLEMNAPYADMIEPGRHTRDLLQAAVETGHFVGAETWLADYEAELARGEGGSHRSFEFQLADGTHLNSVRRPTREGGFVITWLDVTEEKAAAEKLKLLNDRMRDAIESLDEGFALFDGQDRLVMWNKRYDELNEHIAPVIREGVTYGEILETAIATNRLSDEESAKVRESGSRENGNYSRRFEFQHKDGRWFMVSRNPTSEDGFVITRLDITERKEIEAAERESYQLPERMLDACPVALVMSELHTGKNIFRNAEDRALLGDDRASANFWANPAERARFLDRVASQGRVDEMQVMMRRADDSEFPALMSARRIEFKGEPFMVTYTFDLSERIAMERELGRQQEMLHQSEKLSALGELLAGVAHELNNPLSVVVGHSLMLQEEIDDPSVLKRIGKISGAAERCSRIVKTFLAMARQRPAKLELTSINTIIETSLEVAGYGLRSTGAEIHLDLAEDLPPVNVDEDQLAQVFANLIVNSEHAMAGKGAEGRLSLRSRLSKNGKEVVIDVADNGPGIPEAIRARIFEPFFTTKTIGEGTGIGLAFCHRIIDTHGGQISVGVAAGGGAHFWIRLAVAEAAPGTTDETDEVGTAAGRALVIDDEEDVADLIAQILIRDGFDVVTVHSAEAALEHLPGQFDVILSDVNMPGLTGRDFLQAVQERWPGLEDRLGFVTGDTMSPGAEEFLRSAQRPYLEKPVTPVDLRALVAQLHAKQQRDAE